MIPNVTIVTCYKAGTANILSTWCASILRHTKSEANLKTVVLVKQGDIDAGLCETNSKYLGLINCVVEVPIGDDSVSTSRVHGLMLDSFIPRRVDTEYVITMDSDCFPVADGWLSGMIDLIGKGYRVAGILHPWAPPPADMKHSKIEWRVRSQHCWENTHVACQLIKTADLVELNAKFAEGDDTGLLIPLKAKTRQWGIAGYKVTRCPKPAKGKIDPEFNRYVGLVYGDKVFHLGGFTRIMLGDEQMFGNEFGWVTERVLKEQGAEFLLDDACSYKFKFDKEEAVAAEKMQRLFGLRNQRME